MKEENKLQSEKLNDFLRKKPEETSDDFEKEALEGFAMLENDNEILELKQQTDAKVFEKIKRQEPRKNVYWFAAAGLLLCIGLTVFFVTQNGAVDEKNMAMEQKVLNVGDSEPNKIASEQKPEADKTTAEEQSSEPTLGSTASASKKAKPENSALADDENPAGGKDQKLAEEAQHLNEDVYSSGASAASKADYQPTAPASASEELSAAEPKSTIKNVVIADRDEKLSETEASSEKKLKSRSDKAERNSADGPIAKSAPSPEAITISPSSSYPGGNDELLKAVRKDLTSNNINRPFVARLFISRKGKVERVEFVESVNFSKEEKLKLEGSLKRLQKFDNPNGTSATYLLDYKP